MKQFYLKSIVIALAVILFTAGIAFAIGSHVHSMEKEILQQKGELIAKESAREYDRYLVTRKSILMRVGYTVEKMLSEGAENTAILSFLTDETNFILDVLGTETTGLYGWVNGEFLDGAGWVPDADYVATERPWYKQAVSSGNKITFVEPYLDLNTNTVMMTIAEVLEDDKSVVALDVNLDHIQNIVKELAAYTEGSQAMVMDSFGVAVAHSDEEQLGRNYLEEDGLGHMVAEKLLKEGLSVFEVETKDATYAVYAEDLEGDWYSISLINADVWYRPLHRSMLIFFVILGAIVLSIIIVVVRMSAKNLALKRLYTRIDEEERRGEELQLLSEIDRMTGLNDRVSGARKVNEAAFGGLFLELDIDHFKSINDRFGHQKGDEVILAVADVIKNHFRTYDVTMRFGGDEFGAFAVGVTDRETARALVGRLFDRINKIDVLGEEKICISVGAAVCTEAEEFDILYKRADKALYASKKKTGNFLTFG